MTRTATKVQTPLDKMYASFPLLHEKSNGWHANDDNPRFDCLEDENGNIHINSWTGKAAEDILSMGNPPLRLADLYATKGAYSKVQSRAKLDLLTLAEYMKIDWRFLQNVLGYRDEYVYRNKKHGIVSRCVQIGGICQPDGTEHSKNRVRLAIDGKWRFVWDENTPGEPLPSGLQYLDEARAAGHLIAGEGESDFATARFHGLPFLGVPGASAWKFLDVSLLHDIPQIFIIEEPDQVKKNQQEGTGFYASGREWLREHGYAGEIFSIRFKQAIGFKDPSALHKVIFADCKQEHETVFFPEVHDRFIEAMEKAVAQAIPEGNTDINDNASEEEDELTPAQMDAEERLQWVSQLLAVPAKVLSPAHKITLMVIVLHSPIWNEKGEFWWKVDAGHLCKLAAVPKDQFLAHLAYLTNKVNLFVKDHRRTWYTPDGVKKAKCSTELYIQPSPDVLLTYPSTYHVAEGEEERKHGGTRIPKPKCANCGSEELDIDEIHHCRECNHVSILHKVVDPAQEEEQEDDEQKSAPHDGGPIIETEAQSPVESTAMVLPLEEEQETENQTPIMGVIDTYSNDPQDGVLISASPPDELAPLKELFLRERMTHLFWRFSHNGFTPDKISVQAYLSRLKDLLTHGDDAAQRDARDDIEYRLRGRR